ncbi:MAG: Rrf2 family transcriptional regulator [Fimbriimonadales bacterium]
MKFSAQEEYGLRCLLAIGRVGEGGSLTVNEISSAEGLTVPNVAKLVNILRREGFVKSTRGQSGGYALAHDAVEIRLSEVLAALGGKLYDEEFCERHSGASGSCVHDSSCAVRTVWNKVQIAVDDVLEDMRLADLLPKYSGPKDRDTLSGVALINE